MREILFRGKKVDNGEWVYGFYYHGDYKIGSYIIPLGNDECLDVEVEVTPESVGQFTELTDKNETNIFEGDIDKDLGVITYDSLARFCLTYKSHSISLSYADKVVEIIGNIHDNPELLEK